MPVKAYAEYLWYRRFAAQVTLRSAARDQIARRHYRLAGETMPAQPTTQRPWAAIAAVTMLMLPLGSIYAFSVFLRPIEAELGIPRSALSFVFGLATVGFTVGMNLAPLLYRLASPAVLIMTFAIVAALGIEMASRANGLPMLLLGYSVVFGVAGGTIFIILQQTVNLLVRARTGLLNGYVLGLYPLGAMIAAPLFGWSNELHGYRLTLTGLAAALLVFGVVTTWLTIHAGSHCRLRRACGTTREASATRPSRSGSASCFSSLPPPVSRCSARRWESSRLMEAPPRWRCGLPPALPR
jgi:MFS family permease